MANIARLRNFVQAFTRLVEQDSTDEARIFSEGRELLFGLVGRDDWLPDQFARPSPRCYQQFLLYCDPLERFSVSSFVWGAGQHTPVHDHTVWGMVGVMRGAEICQEYTIDRQSDCLVEVATHRMCSGEIDLVSPEIGDIHRVSNAFEDRTSLSIHVYGANIGALSRSTYQPETGGRRIFISGYSSRVLPNLWDSPASATPEI